MIKFSAIVWRRPDVSSEAFTRHWRGTHAGLVRQYASVLGICRYVQSHRVPDLLIDQAVLGRGWLPPPDGLAEVYWPSHAVMMAGMSSLEGQRANAALAEDEARFCDTARMSAFLAEENVVIDLA